MIKQPVFPEYTKGAIVSAGAGSALTAGLTSAKQVILTNQSANLIYVRTGSDPALVATTSDYCILPNSQQVISKSPEHTVIAYIAPAGASNLHFQTAEGY